MRIIALLLLVLASTIIIRDANTLQPVFLVQGNKILDKNYRVVGIIDGRYIKDERYRTKYIIKDDGVYDASTLKKVYSK